MSVLSKAVLTAALATLPALRADTFADRVGQTDLHDAGIEHAPRDGVVRL